MAKQLEGPRAKVQRAQHHVQEPKGAISEFLTRLPYRFTVEADPDQAYQRIVITGAKSIPSTISLIIGDAIHNLRSALDHVAWELFRSRGIKDQAIQFPVLSTAKVANQKISDLQAANPAAANVLASLKPYRGGNLALYGLHRIDIIDKHRLFVRTGRIPGQQLSSFVSRHGTVTIITNRGANLEMMRKGYWRIPAARPLRDGDAVFAHVDIAFAFARPFAGEAVVPLLSDLADYINKVIGSFEAHCFRKEPIVPPTPFWPRNSTTNLLRIT